MTRLISILALVFLMFGILSCSGTTQKTGESQAQDTQASANGNVSGKSTEGVEGEEAAPYQETTDLKELLGDDEEVARLGKFRSFGDTMKIVQMFAETDDTIRHNAKAALVLQGKDAVPALIDGLSSENEDIKVYSAVTLAEIGPDAAPAVSKLIELLDADGVRVPESAAVSLGYIGAPASQALPKLQEVADSHPIKIKMPSGVEVYPVRLAAEGAIKSINDAIAKLAKSEPAKGPVSEN